MTEQEHQTGAAVVEPVKSKSKPKRQPNYVVIVENDDLHTFDYVIDALSKVCGHSREKAFLLAQVIHFTGRSPVWTGTRELAELKRDQIRGFGPDTYVKKPIEFPLGVYIEPLPLD